jgi:hypothetical protein
MAFDCEKQGQEHTAHDDEISDDRHGSPQTPARLAGPVSRTGRFGNRSCVSWISRCSDGEACWEM